MADEDPCRIDFSLYLRTRRRHGFLPSPPDVETKFNPWHDPEDGRFTFARAGRFFARGSASSRQGQHYSKPPKSNDGRRRALDLTNAAAAALTTKHEINRTGNHSIFVVERGDTLSEIAARRKGLSTTDLAWINDIPVDAILQTGQKLRVPTQAWLDFNKDRVIRARRLMFHMAMGGDLSAPKSPTDKKPQINVADPPSIEQQIASSLKTFSSNGYTFVGNDLLKRSHGGEGPLQFGTAAVRSARAQVRAGGEDRRATDHGGHLIAARFNGPSIWYNLIPQDSSFNSREFRKLENYWDKMGKAKHRVFVHVEPHYRGLSRRPYEVEVRWTVDDQPSRKKFPNEAGGR